MKVKTLNPGTVYNRADGWAYTLHINNIARTWRRGFVSAAAAKQDMREQVAILRKRHGLVFSNNS